MFLKADRALSILLFYFSLKNSPKKERKHKQSSVILIAPLFINYTSYIHKKSHCWDSKTELTFDVISPESADIEKAIITFL